MSWADDRRGIRALLLIVFVLAGSLVLEWRLFPSQGGGLSDEQANRIIDNAGARPQPVYLQDIIDQSLKEAR